MGCNDAQAGRPWKAQEADGDLRVHEVGHRASERLAHGTNVLLAGVHERSHRWIGHGLVDRSRIHTLQRVDQRHARRGRDLHEADSRTKRLLSDELGVERHQPLGAHVRRELSHRLGAREHLVLALRDQRMIDARPLPATVLALGALVMTGSLSAAVIHARGSVGRSPRA